MKKIIVTAAIIVSACGFFGVREILAENKNSHVVQKGDTLWDLSGGYLNNPVLWPKIWEINPEIANPHWIRPGQIVKIPGMDKAPAREASADSGVGPVESGASPLARAELVSSSEPLPIVMVKKDLSPSGGQVGAAPGKDDPARYYDRGIGMLTNDIPPSLGRVLHTEQGWRSAALGETILISAPGAQVGRQFGVYRDLGKVDPLAYFDKSPGHVLAEIAIVEVVAADASRQQAVIRHAFAEVRTDDVLGQVPERPVVSARPASAGATSVKGAVVAFHFMRQLAGPDDIVYLNIGSDQGIAPGDLLSVAGKDQSAGRTSGEIMILRVTANTAAAVVTKRSGHAVHRGDVVGPPVL
ncbi:MAG: LysM peptidoglycan-binding domain-containing protein [Desulfobulbaceae bacterium]|nr:LysM peptidoglycan-binding domain-containing protein [Desulfobulbaceae bacterium]HIJ90699.1 LysM peptidoglycan-binding domain-containing protein [Deltaproteobacteria bacterium]